MWVLNAEPRRGLCKSSPCSELLSPVPCSALPRFWNRIFLSLTPAPKCRDYGCHTLKTGFPSWLQLLCECGDLSVPLWLELTSRILLLFAFLQVLPWGGFSLQFAFCVFSSVNIMMANTCFLMALPASPFPEDCSLSLCSPSSPSHPRNELS